MVGALMDPLVLRVMARQKEGFTPEKASEQLQPVLRKGIVICEEKLAKTKALIQALHSFFGPEEEKAISEWRVVQKGIETSIVKGSAMSGMDWADDNIGASWYYGPVSAFSGDAWKHALQVIRNLTKEAESIERLIRSLKAVL